METADTLKRIFNCTDQELADLFSKSNKSVVSHWRKKGLPAAIERQAKEIMKERGIVVAEFTMPYSVEKKADHSPIVEAIIGKVETLTDSQQGEAYALLSKHFSGASTPDKP